jgi:hypothetical protein
VSLSATAPRSYISRRVGLGPTNASGKQSISDTLALGLLNEAIGLGIPIVAVPVPNVALAKHPAFQESIERLRSWGVRLIFDSERYPLPMPNMGPPGAKLFPWGELAEEASKMYAGLFGRVAAPSAVPTTRSRGDGRLAGAT